MVVPGLVLVVLVAALAAGSATLTRRVRRATGALQRSGAALAEVRGALAELRARLDANQAAAEALGPRLRPGSEPPH